MSERFEGGASPRSPEQQTNLAEALFTRMLQEVGPGGTLKLIEDFTANGTENGRGVVAFPSDEHEYGMAIGPDGEIHVQYGRDERFHLSSERAKQIATQIAVEQQDGDY